MRCQLHVMGLLQFSQALLAASVSSRPFSYVQFILAVTHTKVAENFTQEPTEHCIKPGWDEVYDHCKSHLHDHLLTFNDIHILLSCLGSGQKEAVQELMDSLQTFVKEGEGTNRDVAADVGEALCKAFIAYNDGDYATAVDLVEPIRSKVITIGGSHAQRDLFNLFLIQAAIKSPEVKHHKLARALLNERKVGKPNAPMTDRLIAKAIEAHEK
ncbi:tetratricopeptide repeat protein 38-like [Plakobranchus ocellatus]|uniref:Tetratricopeptide repeat protein 38-like n=1 Tax=Plakobranchus ocellatus TaxID=259542 RepID=A0AAV4CQ22_9GAST|nr:tetratricopeptide repeat protein 38-like [Plakobranchus ocellatus]